jgi:hypothetical protein
MKLIAVLCLFAPAAFARIPDFTVANAPEAVKSSTNPKAREFWRALVEHSKKEGRQMFEDTKKTTGLKPGDMKKTDWDCLFWRAAATFAKSVARRHPGLQAPEFAAQVERTSLDEDDCPDEGGPGSYGVQVYNTAINQVMGKRGGWQKSEAPVPSRDEAPASARVSAEVMRAFMAAGVVIGDAARGAAAAAGSVMPILVLPQEMVDELMSGQKSQKPL